MAQQALTVADARAALSRLKGRVNALQERTKEAAEAGVVGLSTIAGGVAAGAIQVKLEKFPGTDLPAGPVIGSFVLTLAMLGKVGAQRLPLASFGGGILAAYAARETEKLLNAA